MTNNDRPRLRLPVSPELDRLHIRAGEKINAGESERYLRDLLGDEVYEMWDND